MRPCFFFFSSRRRHTRFDCDWSSDVCSSDLGAFALLRHVRAGESTAAINIASAPAIPLRLLNHWDNLDGSVERGYAGQSLWDWWTLPDFKDPRYDDYARANASIGIN